MELVYYTESNLFDFSIKNILLLSSLFSLIIGSVLGLTQFRIKRLLAYSTISHVGFILLALSINSAESIQSYIFYIIQYSISNLNAFIILVSIGFSLYFYVYKEKQYKQILKDKNNSPVQLVDQIKGYFKINPFIAISLSITLFSFIGIPPLIGFFAKQMILSAALDNGYIFMAMLAILTSVIGAAYYLKLIKDMFFLREHYSFFPKHILGNYNKPGISSYVLSYNKENKPVETEKKINIEPVDITLNSSLSSSISILTLLLILFIFIPSQ